MDIRNIILPTDLLTHSSCKVIVKTSAKDRKEREELRDIKKKLYSFFQQRFVCSTLFLSLACISLKLIISEYIYFQKDAQGELLYSSILFLNIILLNIYILLYVEFNCKYTLHISGKVESELGLITDHGILKYETNISKMSDMGPSIAELVA